MSGSKVRRLFVQHVLRITMLAQSTLSPSNQYASGGGLHSLVPSRMDGA